MSSSTAMPAARGPGRDFGPFLLILLVAGALGWYFLRDNEVPLDRSAIGHDGLITWLGAGGVEARMGGTTVTAAQVGLRILPIMDTDLTQPFARPETREDYLATGTEIDSSIYVVRRKLDLLPTLMVAPKWTRAVRHSGYAHASLLLPPAEATQAMRLTGTDWRELVRPEPRLMTVPTVDDRWGGLSATLYAPQLFHPELPKSCTSLIGGREGHLLIHCTGRTEPYWALSDPDLINNHGLGLGDNAALTRAIITDLAAGKPVLIDYTSYIFAMEGRPPPHVRGWADLVRFFSWPFGLIWIGLAAVLAVALWRGGRRFGPPRRLFDDRIGASKAVSIAAKARLLRLSGNDAGLIRAYVSDRLQTVAGALTGSRRSGREALTAIAAAIARRDPDRAAAFTRAAEAALLPTANAGADRLLALLDDFELQVETVLDEFGRAETVR